MSIELKRIALAEALQQALIKRMRERNCVIIGSLLRQRTRAVSADYLRRALAQNYYRIDSWRQGSAGATVAFR